MTNCWYKWTKFHFTKFEKFRFHGPSDRGRSTLDKWKGELSRLLRWFFAIKILAACLPIMADRWMHLFGFFHPLRSNLKMSDGSRNRWWWTTSIHEVTTCAVAKQSQIRSRMKNFFFWKCVKKDLAYHARKSAFVSRSKSPFKIYTERILGREN